MYAFSCLMLASIPITDVTSSQTLWWLNAVIESSILIARQYPSYLPPRILGAVIREPQHDVSHIRLTPVWLAGWLMMVSGSCIRLACHRTLGRFFTWDLTVKDNQRIITTGPYGVVRHPAYVGGALIGVGSVLVHFGRGSWFAAYGGLDSLLGKLLSAAWVAWLVGIPSMLIWRVDKEEEVLRGACGEEWEAYTKKTPYRFIPYVY